MTKLEGFLDGFAWPFIAVYRFQRWLDRKGQELAEWLLK